MENSKSKIRSRLINLLLLGMLR